MSTRSPSSRRRARGSIVAPGLVIGLLIAAALLTAPTARAQQSFRNTSAAQPSTDVLMARQTLEYTRYKRDPSDADRVIEDFRLNTQLAYGLTGNLAVIAQFPVYYRDIESSDSAVDGDDLNIGDAHVMFKYRFWQQDTGPLDTKRLSFLAGLDLPIGQGFGNNGWDPMIGLVFTSIQGRHGVNAAARYKFNTHQEKDHPIGPDDSLADTLFIDLAYLYRIFPDSFAGGAEAAWYIMLDLNATYETNGDFEVLLSPGIMYEARRWVFEMSVQFPVAAEVDHRPRVDYSFGIGFRILF